MKEFDLIEIFDEDVMEVCTRCLRLRITLDYWIRPPPELLSVYIDAKPIRELTLCPACLSEVFTFHII